MANPVPVTGSEGPRQTLAELYAESRETFNHTAAQALQKMQTAAKEIAEAQATLACLQGPAAETLAKMKAAQPISQETREVLQRQNPETARSYADHEAKAKYRTTKTEERVKWLKDVVAATAVIPSTFSENLETLRKDLATINEPKEIEPAEAYTGETYEAIYTARVTQHEGAKTTLEEQLEPVTAAATAAAALLEKVGEEEFDSAAAKKELASLAATLERAQTAEVQAQEALSKMGPNALPKYRNHPEDRTTIGVIWPDLEATFAEKEAKTEEWRADFTTRKAELSRQLQSFTAVVTALNTSVTSLKEIQTRAVANLTQWKKPTALTKIGEKANEYNPMASKPLGTRITSLVDDMAHEINSASEERAEELNEKLAGYQAAMTGFKKEIEDLPSDRKEVGTNLLEKLSELEKKLKALQANGWKPLPKEEAPKRKKIFGII